MTKFKPMRTSKHLLAPLALSVMLIGCSSDQIMLQNRVDYRAGSSNLSKEALEVPPGLTPLADNPSLDIPTRNIITAGEVVGSMRQLLPSVDRARIEKAGNQRWLVVQLSPEKAWPVIKQFLQESGFKLTLEKPDAGLLETDWQQNSAKLEQGFLAGWMGRRVVEDERDSFRVRIERGANADQCEIYLSHRGVRAGQLFGPSWLARPNDPALEADMLAQLLQKFGLDYAAAKTVTQKGQAQDQAKLVKASDGQRIELVDEFDRAWRRVGLALERAGYEVVDRDRSTGTFIVRKADIDMTKKEEDSFFSKLAFWRDGKAEQARRELVVTLKAAGKQSLLTVKAKEEIGKEGEAALLDNLFPQLR